MVPGSTFREGSHFWRVTLSPRLSSRQAMEAAATPFPREETTPPVTNTYLGAVRKSLEILRARLGTDHYAEKFFACQTTIRSQKKLPRLPLHSLTQNFLHLFNIRRHIHAHRIVFRFHHSHVKAIFQPAQLLELLDALQFARRQSGKFEQRIAAVAIQTNMFPVTRRHPRTRVPYPRNRRARKIQPVPIEVPYYLHHIRIHDVVLLRDQRTRRS